MILVSACLLGLCTRYDGGHSLSGEAWTLCRGKQVLALCPEILGGLGVPRPPAHFSGAGFGREGRDVLEGRARLLDSAGRDVSPAFVAGARRAAGLAWLAGVGLALLKDRSPSCGWDPRGENPQGGPGQGVLAALLARQGVHVQEIRARAWRPLAPAAPGRA
ncbi:MAG: DUF523 domain-containing protein [Deltaproteobacteria bacterium]|nr:DUF523 domain-containing protein [Deltaproteobacteria bacterium]